MSSHEETQSGSACDSQETREVRRVFSAMPLEQRVTALFQVQFDLVADVIEGAASTVSKVLDDVAKSFSSSTTATGSSATEEPPSPANP
ncbi:MAG: hypothetical protein AB1757_30650 [Acidobacteriota bacterium]